MRRRAPLAAALVLCLVFGFFAMPAAAAAPGDPFSCQVTLEGTALALPCPVFALADAGWQTAVPADEPFQSKQYAPVVFTKGEAAVTATVANRGQSAAALPSCDVVGLSAIQGEAALALAGGLSFGTDAATVLAACGVPDGGRTDGPPQTLRYTMGRSAHLQFAFENGQLAGLEVLNWTQRPAPPDPAALPAEAQSYTSPAALGTDWQTYTLDYAEALYTLPAPVSAFLQNGWLLLDDATLPGGGWLLGVRLQKGNQILRTRVQNNSAGEAELAGCFVTKVESSRTGADLPLALPGGVTGESTLDEVAALLGPPHAVYQISTAVTYTYHGGQGRLDCTFSPQTGAMLALEVSCNGLADGPIGAG